MPCLLASYSKCRAADDIYIDVSRQPGDGPVPLGELPAGGAAGDRWRLAGLLRPILGHPGLITLWQSADTAPAAYFNHRPAALTLTHLLPPAPTTADRTLAGWYAEYLFLCLVNAAQARRQQHGPAPSLLLVLDDLSGWWDSGLLATISDPLGPGRDQLCGPRHTPAAAAG